MGKNGFEHVSPAHYVKRKLLEIGGGVDYFAHFFFRGGVQLKRRRLGKRF
jgi:hypothetical protein